MKKHIFLTVILISVSLFFACEDPGASAGGASSPTVIVVNPPDNLIATVISSGRIDLSWDDMSDNEDGFRIEQSLDGTNYDLISEVLVDTVSYEISGLDPATEYYYRVQAYNSSIVSEYSNIAVGETSDIAPAAPSSVTATAVSSSRILLTWNDTSANEDGFSIEISLDGSSYSIIDTVLEGVETYENTLLESETEYYYRIRAYNSVGYSDYSNTDSAVTDPESIFLIVDHSSVLEFDTLTSGQIEEAKKVLMIISGESHGRGYGYGLESLEADNSMYDASTTWSGAAESYRTDALRWNRAYLDGTSWNTSMGEEDFWTNTSAKNDVKTGLTTVAASYSGTVLFGFGWCWDATWHNSPTTEKDPVYGCGWAGSTVAGADGDKPWGLDAADGTITGNSLSLQDYLAAVDEYNAHTSGVITLFTTGPVDGNLNNENGYQRWLKHEAIREYVQENGGVLFDYADILSYDYDNDQRITESWNGNTWNGINTDFVGEYDGGDGSCHISEDACVQLAKGLWVLAAKVAELDL